MKMAWPYDYEGEPDPRTETERAFAIYSWEHDGDPDDCDVCPFRKNCVAEGLYWGCTTGLSEMDAEDL
jgi:hypothetical protein